ETTYRKLPARDSMDGNQLSTPQEGIDIGSANHWEIEYSSLQLGKELGRGAFGVVFSGYWRSTPGTKILHISLSDISFPCQQLQSRSSMKECPRMKLTASREKQN